MPREITAYSNPLVKRVRLLREKRHRRDEGLFLAEGLRILAEAEEAGILPEWLFYAADSTAHPIVRRLTLAVEAKGGEAIQTSRDILHKLSGKDNPQAVSASIASSTPICPRWIAPPRASGSSPRRCAIPAISARSCAPAMRSVPAGSS